MAAEVDLERATARAWQVFERELARRMNELEPGETIRFDVEGPEREALPGTPYVRVHWHEDELVADIPQNRALIKTYRLSKDARDDLVLLGWDRVEAWHVYRLNVSSAGSPAMQIRELFGRHWGVPHPSFLVDADDTVDPARCKGLRSLPPKPDWSRIALQPGDEEDLHDAVRNTLTQMIGDDVEADDDGDFVFYAHRSLVVVRVLDAERVRLWSPLVGDVKDLRMARHEVNVLNRDVEDFKFILVDDAITMRSDLQASPFAPEHLRRLLGDAMLVVEREGPNVAFRVGGKCFFDDAEVEE